MNSNSIQLTADSLLRAFSSGDATTVSLRLPGTPTGDPTSIELGLAPIPTEDVPVAPALVRAKSAGQSPDLAQYELLLSASAIDAIQTARGFTSAAALFNAALGMLVNGALLRVISFSSEMIGSVPALHRLIVSE